MKNEKPNSTVRVLHLNDSPLDAELVAMALAMQTKEFPTTVHYVQNRQRYTEALDRKDFDVILSDYRMPDFDGEQALTMARERCPEISFIMVTGELGEEWVIETLKRGATDYVLKDRIFRLVPAIKRALAEAEIQRKRRVAEEKLRASEERFSAAFRASPDPFVISRVDDGMILDVSEAFLSECFARGTRGLIRLSAAY
jgi:phosphoserine phosphatase RsbU/P